jgi:hypothetical protein
MFCPVCGYEYVASATVCSDCNVALVPQLTDDSSGGQTQDASTDAHWVVIWSGGDPRRHEDLCAILEDEGVPVRTALEGGLLNISSYAAYDIYVPSDLLTQATEVLRQLAVAEREWEESGEAQNTEVSGGDDDVTGDPLSSRRGGDWYPEDATAEVWSGDNLALARMIAASLRENHIRCRFDSVEKEEATAQKLFVLPEHGTRAREIVTQIVEAAEP